MSVNNNIPYDAKHLPEKIGQSFQPVIPQQPADHTAQEKPR